MAQASGPDAVTARMAVPPEVVTSGAIEYGSRARASVLIYCRWVRSTERRGTGSDEAQANSGGYGAHARGLWVGAGGGIPIWPEASNL